MIEEKQQTKSSVLKLADSYAVVSIVTTGEEKGFDSIISIGAVKYVNGKETECFKRLCKPESYYLVSVDQLDKIEDYCIVDGGPVQYVTQAVTKRTNITNEMLYGAKELEPVLAELREFLGKTLVVGYEMEEIFSWIGKESISNDYVEMKRIAKRIRKDRNNPSLLEMAIYYEIEYGRKKDVVYDCQLVHQVYEAMKQDFINEYGSVSNFERLYEKTAESRKVSYSNVVEGTLWGKNCVFTGTLTKMVRGEAMRLVRECGGITATSVTSKTDYLVLGNKEYEKRQKGIKSNKLRKAERMVEEGASLRIISEDAFFELLDRS